MCTYKFDNICFFLLNSIAWFKLVQVADLYKITAYDTVTVTQIARRKQPYVRRSIAADFVTVTMKDQFVSRGDMHLFQKAFLNKWVYEGKRLSFDVRPHFLAYF